MEDCVTSEMIGDCNIDNHIDIVVSYGRSSYCHGSFVAFSFSDEQMNQAAFKEGIDSTKIAFNTGLKEGLFCN